MRYSFFALCLCVVTSCSLDKDDKNREKEYMVKANNFANKQLWDSAIYYNKKALELNDSILYYSNIGVIFNIKNMPEKAIFYLDSAIKLSLNDAQLYIDRAESFYQLGDFKKAISDLEYALKINPELSEAKVGLAEFYYKCENYDLAIKYLNEVILIEPNNEFFKFRKGKSYLYLKEYELAINEFSELLKIKPLDYTILIARGEAYSLLEDYNSSIKDYNQAIEINPNQQSTVYRNLAEIYLMIKKNKKKSCEYIHLDAKFHQKEVSQADFNKYCGN